MRFSRCALACVLVVAATSVAAPPPGPHSRPGASPEHRVAFEAAMQAQPKLLCIAGRIDGSGKFVFGRKAVRYVHKHWAQPRWVLFDGEPWARLDRTPPAWRDVAHCLDLSRARVVKRQGRDVIALEHTPEGFDLSLCDSPNGAADYTVTLAIPRRN